MTRAVVGLSTGVLLLLSACSESNDTESSPVMAGMGAVGGGGDTGGSGGGGDPAMPDDPLKAMGPTDGQYGQGTTSFVDLSAPAYSEKEYFFEGVASSYAVQGAMGMDGKWTLSKDLTSPYKTRLYVRRPIDASKFNGTVVVEWLNVSGGLDADPGYMYNNPLVFREGWVWVGVSAQQVGVEGGISASSFLGGGSMGAPTGPGSRNLPLKMFDPERYASLAHPGDHFSYDIFTQAARVVRGEGGVDVLEGLVPERIIAYGESQSAGRMVAYVNGVAPLENVFDGYFIHSRGAAGSGFSSMGGLLAGFGGGSPTLIRDDLGAPVLQFQTETDVAGMFGFFAARQPDSEAVRSWEVAGTAHADQYLTDQGAGVAGSFTCEGANDGPQQFVIRAALRSLDRWIADGTLPPATEPLTMEGGKLVLDEHGNTLGGVRSPDVDVPIAIQSGNPPAEGGSMNSGLGAVFCGIFGSTVPFSAEKLLELYPTHEDYVTKVRDSARMAVERGHLLAAEEEAMVAEAEAAPIPQ